MSNGKVIISKEEYDELLLFKANGDQEIKAAEAARKTVLLRIDPRHSGNDFYFSEVTVSGPQDFKPISDMIEEKLNHLIQSNNSLQGENQRLENKVKTMEKTFSEFKESFRKMSTLIGED